MSKKSKLRIGKLVKLCPGKRHGWYDTAIGLVRKPLRK